MTDKPVVADGIIRREDEILERAAKAAKRVEEGVAFADWICIGDGLVALRDRAMRESFSNQPSGRAYSNKYAALKDTHKWVENYDKATISHAVWLSENVAEVTRWRDTLTASQKQAWVHPRTVHTHYDKATKVPVPEEDKPPSSLAQARASVVRLQEEVDLLRNRSAGGLMPGASANDVTEAIFRAHHPAWVRRLIAALQAKLSEEEGTPAKKVRPKRPANKETAAPTKPKRPSKKPPEGAAALK